MGYPSEGKGKKPPPPAAPAGGATPKAKAKPLPPKPVKPGEDTSLTGMAQLQAKVEATKEEMDRKNATEIEGVDMSGIDPNAKGETFTCPRCEKEILASMRESHKNSHSAEILPWLFLGGTRNANNGKELTVRTGITHILNVAHEVTQDHEAKAEWEEYNKERGLPCEYMKYPWTDTKDQDIIQEMSGPIAFIKAAREADPNNRVLVHCIQGISRSTSVVLLYLMLHEHMSLKEAYRHTKEVRPVIEPRREFLDQLASFECRSFGLERPTLDTEEIYSGRTVLNVDEGWNFGGGKRRMVQGYQDAPELTWSVCVAAYSSAAADFWKRKAPPTPAAAAEGGGAASEAPVTAAGGDAAAAVAREEGGCSEVAGGECEAGKPAQAGGEEADQAAEDARQKAQAAQLANEEAAARETVLREEAARRRGMCGASLSRMPLTRTFSREAEPG